MNSSIFHLPFAPLEESPPDLQAKPVSALGLPPSYGSEKLVALPKDPHWIWLYWELDKNKPGEIGASGAQKPQPVIRLLFAQSDQAACEVATDLEARNYYLKAPISGQSYYAELGLKRSGTSFTPWLRSNVVTVPYGYPADKRPGEAGDAGSVGSLYHRPERRAQT